MTSTHWTFAILLAALSACSAPNPSQYVIEAPAVAETGKVRTTIEVLEVSLPLYAQGQEIPFAESSGAIRTDQSAIWADMPSRAISLSLAESLSKLTGSVTAVEPWPLEESAAVKLDVRVKNLLASAEGSLEFSGQYFIVYGSGRNPVSDWFEISIPVAGQSGAEISKATGAAINELAQMVVNRMR